MAEMDHEKTRSEHIRWCKQRAWQEHEHALRTEGAAAARQAACTSMLSDLRKHSETAGMVEMAFLMALTVNNDHELHRFIDGFTE